MGVKGKKQVAGVKGCPGEGRALGVERHSGRGVHEQHAEAGGPGEAVEARGRGCFSSGVWQAEGDVAGEALPTSSLRG